jgi:hypothetical protein
MPCQSLARARRLALLILFLPILACSPLALVQQEAPTAPPAQALATRPPEATVVPPTTAPTVAPTSTRAPTAATTLDAPKATLVTVQPTSAPASKATTSATSAAGGPEAKVKNALDAMTKKSYRGTIKGTDSSMTFEFAPNNYHITYGGNEYILIADKQEAYMKSGGKWSKTDSGSAGFLLFPIFIGSGYADKMTNVKMLPNETLGGASMQVVSYTGQYAIGGTPDSLTTPSQYKMWIGADGLPRQVTFQETGKPVGTTTLQYDSSIKITAPTLP